MGLKGNLNTLRSLKHALQQLPKTASARIASQAAPEVSALTRAAFDDGHTVYGQERPRGVDGQELALVKSGATREAVRFVANGTQMRTAVLPRYTKYLIAKYECLPPGRAPLPLAWRERMNAIAEQVLRGQLPRSG